MQSTAVCNQPHERAEVQAGTGPQLMRAQPKMLPFKVGPINGREAEESGA